MKKKLLMLLLLLFVSFACEESTTEPPVKNNPSDFFPNSDGNHYYYNVSIYDSNGTIIQSGTKKSYYNSDTIIFSTSYQAKVDSFQLTGIQTVSNSYFRKNSTGVFNCVEIDSNGFYYLIPDSLRGNFSLTLEYPILYESLEVNEIWHVFDIHADIPQFEVFNVDAEVISIDTTTILFQNTSLTDEVIKIKYDARLTTNLSQPQLLFEVNAWIAKGIGFIKWEGDAKLINFFAGANIYASDTKVLEELYSFKLN
jgi:hypothetical protein